MYFYQNMYSYFGHNSDRQKNCYLLECELFEGNSVKGLLLKFLNRQARPIVFGNTETIGLFVFWRTEDESE